MRLADHAAQLERAIFRAEERQSQIEMSLGNWVCCPGCASPEWANIERKLRRQRGWLAVLNAKLGKGDLSVAEASSRYDELLHQGKFDEIRRKR